MTYLSVTKFWDHQDRNAWKKAKYHPPWFKHAVSRDRDLDKLPLEARLLWWELLACATRYSNVLEADPNWLSAETRIPVETITVMLPLLVNGAWLSETKTSRRAPKPAPNPVPNPDVLDVDVDVDKEKTLSLTFNGSELRPKPVAHATKPEEHDPTTDHDTPKVISFVDIAARAQAARPQGDAA